jgi:DNA-binding CsgD family transcriptional regulator
MAGTALMTGQMVACHGAADRYLGMLAATLGDHETAESHLERALELDRRTGWRLWVAHSAYEYGHFLLGQGRREAARTLIGEAAGLAEPAGMSGLLAKIDRLGVVPGDGGLPDGISPREAQILTLVARGMSNRGIGEELSISEHTAANHVRSILRKTGCANRTEAASYAHRHGLAPA